MDDETRKLVDALGNASEENAFEAVCQWLVQADRNLQLVHERCDEIASGVE